MIYLQVWWDIICLLQVFEDLLFQNQTAMPHQEFMFLKLEKVHLESCLRYRKTTLRYFGFQTSLNLCIFFSFYVNSRREVFLENVPENMFSFPDAFFSYNVFIKCFTAIVLLLSATLLKVEVLNRLASNRNNT